MPSDSPLRFVRKAVFRVKQDEMAAIGGVSRPRVSRYESGEDPPSYRYMLNLRAEAKARGLDFSGDWFFEVPAHPADEAGS